MTNDDETAKFQVWSNTHDSAAWILHPGVHCQDHMGRTPLLTFRSNDYTARFPQWRWLVNPAGGVALGSYMYIYIYICICVCLCVLIWTWIAFDGLHRWCAGDLTWPTLSCWRQRVCVIPPREKGSGNHLTFRYRHILGPNPILFTSFVVWFVWLVCGIQRFLLDFWSESTMLQLRFHEAVHWPCLDRIWAHEASQRSLPWPFLHAPFGNDSGAAAHTFNDFRYRSYLVLYMS